MEANGWNFVGNIVMKLLKSKVRKIIKEALLEALSKTDKTEIEKIVARHIKSTIPAEIKDNIEKEVKKRNSALDKKIDDVITTRFKKLKSDKDFDAVVIKISKRVLKGLHDMHYKRSNLIDQMPVPKN